MSAQHSRVARIGADGEADLATEELVPTGDVTDLKRAHVTRIGGRGALILPADVRKRYGLDDNALVQLTEEADGVFVRKVRVVPADDPEPADLETLLAGVTPENLREEIDFGPARGAESL